jgi:hypothetical protein
MSRKFFTPPQPSPNPRFGSKRSTNDLGLLYTASDDFNFPDHPVLAFENGLPIQFGFQVAPGNGGGV